MLVPAKLKLNGQDRAYKIGETFHIKSGMGGCHLVEIVDMSPKYIDLRCNTKDHEHTRTIDLATAHEHLGILVPS